MKKLPIVLIANILLAFCAYAQVTKPHSPTSSEIPEDQDIALKQWNTREKYYLIVAVDQNVVPGAALPFAKTDAQKLSQALESHGFRKLDVLTSAAATHDNFVVALQKAQCKDSSSLILVYYSGHGVVAADNNELWLQLAGQPKLADRLGITIRDIVGSARGNCYSGELSIVIDSCFSGEGVLTSGLTLREFGTKTSILSSSSEVEESYSRKKSDGTEISAFTDALIRALNDEYETADDNSDGFLIWDELSVYSQNELNTLLKDHSIPKRMDPHQLSNPSSMFISYDRSHVKRWNSQIRRLVTQSALANSLALSGIQLGIRNTRAIVSETPLSIPEQSQKIAQQVVESPSSYVSGLKAIAMRKFTTARKALKLACREPGADLRDCYLALARNEMYSGRPSYAVSWYRKAIGFSLPLDIELQNEAATALLRNGQIGEGMSILNGLVKAQDAFKLEDARLATSLHNLATAQLQKGKLVAAEQNYKRALEVYRKTAPPNSTWASTSADALAELYARNGQAQKASEYRTLSAQLLPPTDSIPSTGLDTFFGKVQDTRGVIGFVRTNRGQQSVTWKVDNPEALEGHKGQYVLFKGEKVEGISSFGSSGTVRVMSQPKTVNWEKHIGETARRP